MFEVFYSQNVGKKLQKLTLLKKAVLHGFN